ncbi:MAG TPA: tetratricopeptide repeat protein, partial [Anaerolineae bacterium]|nr:tetratricopeptide repeat protein [Anaerolineae bacterium]
LILARGFAYRAVADIPATIADYEAALNLARELHAVPRQVQSITRLVEIYCNIGRATEARPRAEEALQLARGVADRKSEADSLEAVGATYIYISDYAHAKEYYEQALTLYRELGDRAGEAQCLRRLGWVAGDLGDLSLARDYQHAALALYREIGDRNGEVRALNMLAISSLDYADQRAYEEEALDIARAIGSRDGQALMYGNLSAVYNALGLYSTARDYVERGVQIYRELESKSYLANGVMGLADLHLIKGEYDQVEPLLTEARSLAEASDDPKTVGTYWLQLGRLRLAQGQAPAAHAAFEKFDELAHQLKMPAYFTQAWTLMGAASLALGEVAAAQHETSEAVRQLEALGTVVTDIQTQEIWWWRYQALKADKPKGKTKSAQLIDEAWQVLQKAYDAMLANIATLSDEGLRRNYLNKVKLNRDILIEWTRQAIDRTIPIETAVARSGNLQEQFRRLLSIGVRLNEPREVSALLDFIMDQLIELSGAERALLILVDQAGQRSIAASRGYT